MPTTSPGGRGPAAAQHAARDTAVGKASADWNFTKRPDMTWHDHLIMLLQIGAEIEHALMVQYLYAAYSLGGPQVPKKHWKMVKRWQKSILAVAKEEMGHLLTVENLLTALGGPIDLSRGNFPWANDYYPFPLTLEPLTLDSLSCYVYAEMPADSAFSVPAGRNLPARYEEFEEEDKLPIVTRARARVPGGDVHRVAMIYDEIIHIIEDPEPKIPDSLFQEDTFNMQASWDDWGRGYQADPYLLDAEGNRLERADKKTKHPKVGKPSSREAHVLIDRIATRTQALGALRALSGQGEAPHLQADDTGEPSHFERFLEIYQEFEHVVGWMPSRAVAVNPTILEEAGNQGEYISATPAHDWAKLFNLRYRMLLAYLAHTFRLARVTRPDEPNLRAMVMHKVFGEMYNLKTIAGVLVRLPLRDPKNKKTQLSEGSVFAGAPFEVPYTLRLPPSESDAWRLHFDLLRSSTERCVVLLPLADEEGRRYLKTLLDLDGQSMKWIDRILAGASAAERGRV